MKRFILAALLFAAGASLYQPVFAQTLAQRLSGKILLQVEANGEAWYVYPDTHERFYLGRPADAFAIMRNLGLGISNADLSLVPEAGSSQTGSLSLRSRLSGKILLQVESKGEAWYVFPDTLKRSYLGRPDDAFKVMRELGLGISDENLLAIPVAEESAVPSNGGDRADGHATQGTLGDELTTKRISLLNEMNLERASKGLVPYSLIKELSQAAQTHADDMTQRSYFSFTSPEGIEIPQRLEEAGYVAYIVAQNLIQTNHEVTDIVDVWKSEQDISYQNVVDADYENIGIGIGMYQNIPFYFVVFARSLESFFTEKTASLADLNAVRNEMLNRLNTRRAQSGLAPLTLQVQLTQSAQAHAQDMFDRAYYAHETPEGMTPHERITATGYPAIRSAENIAKGQFSVEEVMQAWIDSPDHLANILGEFTEVGFGLAYGKSQSGFELYWVQNFGAR